MLMRAFIKVALFTVCICHAQAAAGGAGAGTSGIDPIALHGFARVHATGITGKGQHIAFIERMLGMSARTLPAELQGKKEAGQMCVYDCSHEEVVLPGAEDKSMLRILVDMVSRIEDAFVPPSEQRTEGTYHDHEIQTASLGLGTKGAAPQASYLGIHHGLRYASGILDFGEYMRAGSSIYPYWSIAYLAMEKRKHQFYKGDATDAVALASIERKIKDYPANIQAYLTAKAVDRSILDAIRVASSTLRCIINMSIDLTSITDPFDNFNVPSRMLDEISSWLEASDSILVLAATNLADGGIEKKKRVDGYLRSFARHAGLGPRTLIAINIESQPSAGHFKETVMLAPDLFSQKTTLPNGTVAFLRPFSDSNLPLESGWEGSAICALGANIEFPSGLKSSGTSLSAPIISGLAALIQEKYPYLSGPDVVQRIKNTALKLGNPKLYGHGLINPLAAILEDTHCCTIM